jgi:hypothetical protein
LVPARATALFKVCPEYEPAYPNMIEEVRLAPDLYGAFPVKRLLLGFAHVLCSERERPFFIPSPAIQFPERAEGVKGPKTLAELGGLPP